MNEIGLTQCQKILNMMYENRSEKKVWYAKDFQRGKYFVGYEATARMSDLLRMYPQIFKVGKDGRYRTLELNLDEEQFIKDLVYGYDKKN